MKKLFKTPAGLLTTLLLFLFSSYAKAQNSSEIDKAIYQKIDDVDFCTHLAHLRQRFGTLYIEMNGDTNKMSYAKGVYVLDSVVNNNKKNYRYLIESINQNLNITPLNKNNLTDSIPCSISIFPEGMSWIIMEKFSSKEGFYFFQKDENLQLLFTRLQTWKLTKIQ